MKKRCAWVNLKNPLYIEYHDLEWGRPVHEDKKHFEFIVLEAAQAGLSWETVLKKRERYRKVFSGFDPKKVAQFSKAKVKNLLNDSGIIRNRLKIESAITNAKAFLKIQEEFGSFDSYVWAFVKNKPLYHTFRKLSDCPSKTKISDRISKDLKERGFSFVGSTIVYSYMQAVGLTQDHSYNCYLYRKKFRK